MKLLDNKTALITGASRGIGKSIAKVLSHNGANIAFTYNSSLKLAKELEESISKSGVKCKSYQSDAAIFSHCEELVKQVLSDFSSIDILINNAGITKDNLLMRMSENDFDKVIEVNLKSVFNIFLIFFVIFSLKKQWCTGD